MIWMLYGTEIISEPEAYVGLNLPHLPDLAKAYS